MSREEVVEYLEAVLSRSAGAPFPRPAGAFVGDVRSYTASGLRLVAPDGTLFYLAVLPLDAFEVLPE